MHNEQREQFEKWLRTVCFQQPTPEAYDLAWQAWKAAQQSVQADLLPCGHSSDNLGNFGGCNPMGSCVICDAATSH